MRRIAVPLTIALILAACTSAEPEALTTTTASPAGSLEIDHDDQIGISIAPQGFDEWML